MLWKYLNQGEVTENMMGVVVGTATLGRVRMKDLSNVNISE